MEEEIQEAVKFFNDKFELKKEVKSGEIPFPKYRFVKIRVGAARTKHIVDLYCESNEDFEELKNIIKNDKEMNDIYKEVSGSRCFTVENQSIEEQCRLLGDLYDTWKRFQSASDETQSADAESKGKKDCETVQSDYPTNTDPLFPSSNFDMSRLEEFGEKEMLNGISDLEYKFNDGKFVEDVYGKPINFASWGNWKTPDSKITSNLEFSNELLQGLQPNIVFCGLNVSTDVEHGNWNNFHKKGDCGNSNLRDSIIRTRLQGAYFTDLIKFYSETAGRKVKNYFKNNKGELERHAEWFVEEMIQLKEFFWKDNSKLPLIIIVMGKAAKSLFETAEIEKKLREKFKDVWVYPVRHYSRDYKKELPEKIREIVREIEQDL